MSYKPFYFGQQDYIDQLNLLANGAVGYDPLTVTKTGSFLYTPLMGRVPVPVMDNLDGTFGTPLSGKAVTALYYDEGQQFVTSPSNLTALAFTDMASVYNLTVQNCLLLQSLGFPALTSAGVSGVSNAQSFAVNNCPVLTSLDLTSLKCSAAGVQFSGLGALTTLSLPALTQGAQISIGSCPLLTSFSAPLLTNTGGGGIIFNGHALTTISLPSLQFIQTTSTALGLFGASNSTLTTISMPSLISVGGIQITSTHSALTGLSFPALQRVLGITVNATCAAFTSLSLPAIVELGSSSVNITQCANLVTVTLGSTLKACTGNFTMTGAKLNQASVDSILARLAALDGTGGTTAFSSPRTVNLSGGTSSTPSSAGLTSKATLVARGVTVTHN